MKSIPHFKSMLSALLMAELTCASRAVDFHVATAQDLQNALTVAAANGANNNIWLTNGYYVGTFNYNNTASYSLAIMAETNLNNSSVTIDGGGGGRDMNLTCSGSSGNMTVSNITFIRNCGNYQIGALRIAASSGGAIVVDSCRFLSTTNSSGTGIEIASGQNTTIQNCTVIGKTNVFYANGSYQYDGNGLSISGVTGNTLIFNSTFSANSGDNNHNAFGVFINASSVLTVSNNIFQTNYSSGLMFQPSVGGQTAQLLVVGNVFASNGGNGAAYFTSFNSLNIYGNTLVIKLII